MKKLITFCFLLGLGLSASGQDSSDDNVPRYYHEYGLNMTGLVSQFVPFKPISSKIGPYSFSYKYFFSDTRAFRTGLGLNLLADGNTDNLFLNLRMGFEFRNRINEKWLFFRSVDGMVVAGNFNVPFNDFNGNDQGGIGGGIGAGIEYFLLPNVSLSVESIFFAGIVVGQVSIVGMTIIPPTSLSLNVKI